MNIFKDLGSSIHNDLSYHPRAASNPQTPWAYPDNSLPEFRHWFRREYLPTKSGNTFLRSLSFCRAAVMRRAQLGDVSAKVVSRAGKLAMLARVALCIARFSLVLTGMGSLFGCGIFGDWLTNVVENRSSEAVIATPVTGEHAGQEHYVPSGQGLTVEYGGFGYNLTIRTTSQPTRVIFSGHLCFNQSVLLVSPVLTVSCVSE